MQSSSPIQASLGKDIPFAAKHSDRVSGALTCFDRVIFKGYLPLSYQSGLESFVDNRLKMRRKDFLDFAKAQSEKLVEHAKRACKSSGVCYEFLKGKHRKEAIVQRILRDQRITEGLVCVLATMECCSGVRLKYGQGRPRLACERRQQRVLYFYFMDRRLGLLYVRLQTWFPLTVQVYVNGHSWLARQLQRRGIGFVQQDNAFTELGDFAAAQKLADRFGGLDWPKILERLVRKVNVLMSESWFEDLSYYWVTDQAEVATDVLFVSRNKLAAIFAVLLAVASRFSPKDVLSYLGRRLHGNFDGEVMTDYKTDRFPGARIKHRMKNNWLKMYDKFGLILRVETVINDPREFRVRKKCIRNGREVMAYVPMAKGVSNLRHYYRHAKAANRRYLDALSAVEQKQVAGKDLRLLTARKAKSGRSYAGFSPVEADHVRFLKAVLDGNHLLRGFHNADVRRLLYPQARDRNQARRRASAIGRQLKRLHIRKMIAHIPRTRRWRITPLGQRLLQSAVHLYDHGVPNITTAP